jgi:c-di-GMP-specific phosphodiesterase
MDEMGMMVELGSHMMRASARQLGAWRKAHPAMAGMTVSVNLSTGEIDRENLVEDVGGLVRKYGLPKGALKLEITESDIMRDPDRAAVVLRALRDAGAGLALDDFGTGFSSMAYLKRFAVQVIKIDRVFIDGFERNADSEAIVAAIIAMSHALGKSVIAEGVETEAQLALLRKLHCDEIQGFLLSRAVPPAEFAELVRHRARLAAST